MTSNHKQQWLKLPKADVHNHLHLGGSQERFKRRYPKANIDFPNSYNGLAGMIDFIYNHLNTVMLTKTDVINFMEIAIESAIDDNVLLLEASVDVGLIRFFNDSAESLIETVKMLKEKYMSQICFSPDLGFNKDLDLIEVYSKGVTCLKSGVFNGIDLYGKENEQDLRSFVRLYDMARDYGLRTKVHIGEFSNHTTIEETIMLLSPDELQHGVSAVSSKKTMDLILENQLRLNVCPSSNVALGAIESLEKHPIRRLFDYGIQITINTDDLILFNATITDEFVKLMDLNIFSFEELDQIRKNAFNRSIKSS